MKLLMDMGEVSYILVDHVQKMLKCRVTHLERRIARCDDGNTKIEYVFTYETLGEKAEPSVVEQP